MICCRLLPGGSLLQIPFQKGKELLHLLIRTYGDTQAVVQSGSVKIAHINLILFQSLKDLLCRYQGMGGKNKVGLGIRECKAKLPKAHLCPLSGINDLVSWK